MLLLDRYVLGRFVANFAILFALLFLFASMIDLILALDEFVEAAKTRIGDDAGALRTAVELVRLALDFQGPRLFQFYAYLHGLVAIGAMAFTLARMHRAGELTAILAAGIGLPRLAMPFVIGTFALSVLQLLNQELLLPRVAPLLLRTHEEIGERSIDAFPIRFTPDGAGGLLQAPRFEPRTRTLHQPTILVRDDRGRTVRRVTADDATWVPAAQAPEGVSGWALANGTSVRLLDEGDASTPGRGSVREPVAFQPSDLSPELLVIQRHGQYASMLSLRQISTILETPGVAGQEGVVPALARYRYGRFASVLVNVLLMFLALPAFLLREPANLLLRSLQCAASTLPAMIGAAIFMMVPLPGFPPAVSVFTPVVLLLPVVLFQWSYLRT